MDNANRHSDHYYYGSLYEIQRKKKPENPVAMYLEHVEAEKRREEFRKKKKRKDTLFNIACVLFVILCYFLGYFFA